MSMNEIEEMLESGPVTQVVVALLSAALYGEQRGQVSEWIVQRLEDENPEIVNAAIISVGHCARIDKRCDVDLIGPAFKRLYEDHRFIGRLDDALDDIEVFRGCFGIAVKA